MAAVRDAADLQAANNARALAAATKEQAQALGDQLAQMKLRLLEAQAGGGPKFSDIVVPPEQAELVRQRLEALRNQYRDLIEQLRQAGNTDGLAIVEQSIKSQALEGIQGQWGQVTEFGIQAARNIQSGFAEFLFDPFKGGLNGMARDFLNTLRQMAANAASATLMKGLLGEHFEKGEIGGLLGDVVAHFKGGKPETPYIKGTVPESMQVGPPVPAAVAAPTHAAVATQSAELDGVLTGFKDGFIQLFDGDFFAGLGSIWEQGFSPIFSGLAGLFGQLFNLFNNNGYQPMSGGQIALKLVGAAVGAAASYYGGSAAGGVVNAASNAGSSNGAGAVGTSMNNAGAGNSWGSSFGSGVYHRGGLVGSSGEHRALPMIAFARAPRYHSGGIAGLAPNEVPAVLMGGPKGQREEVLTANDPRHRDNLGFHAQPFQGACDLCC